MKKFYMKKNDVPKWASVLRRMTLAVMVAVGTAGMNAQVGGYTFSQANGTFASIAATGSVIPGSEATTGTTNDTAGWQVSLPFTFNFNNANYTSIYVNSNGAATFGTTISTSSSTISATAAYDGAIAVMNRDLFGAYITTGVTTSGSNVITNVVSMQGIEVGKLLNNVDGIPANTTVTAFDEVAGTITMSNPATSGSAAAVVRYGTGRVYTATQGTAPNRVFVIEWKGYNDYGITAALSNHLNFQLRLSESTNKVSIVYGPTYNISTTSRTNQIGLRGTANTDFNNRTGAVGNPWVSTAAGTTNAATVARDNTNYPAVGLTFNWTPPACYGTTNFAVSGQSLNSVSLAWSAPTGSSPISYTVYYSTLNTAPTSSTVLNASNSVTVNGLSATVSGLNPATTYYFWVRSNCSATDFSIWSNPAAGGYTGYCIPATGATTTRYVETLTTTGGMTNLNYSAPSYAPYVDQSATSFSSYPTGTINYSIDASTTSSTYYYIWVDWNNDMDFEDAGEKVLGSASVATSTGSFTIPITIAYGSYRVRVAAATVSTIGACGTPANGNYVDFTLVVAAPSGCIAPSNLTSANETYNSAHVSWTTSVTPPANGYEVYYSTSATPPTSSTVLNSTNSVTGIPTTTYTATISGLTPLTKYYFWVRSVCSGTSTSEWTLGSGSFFTLCQPPAIINVMGATVCPGSSTTLSATADAGATITWYDAPTGGNTLTTGNSYTTPNLSSTTNYYVSALAGSSQSVGVANPGALTNAGTTTAGTTFYIEATVVSTPMTVQSVDVFPDAAGYSSFIRVYLGTASTPVYEIPFTSNVASGGVTPQTVPLNIVLSPGVYRFKIEGAGSYYRNYLSPGGVGQAFPYGQGNFTLTGGSNVTTGYYLFYNFIVGNTCESARQQVTASVDAAACLSTSEVTKNYVTIYPNPFTDVLNISDVKGVKSISVLDISGRVVKSIDRPTAQINLSELKSGMYLISLQYKDGSVHTMKAIKK